MPKIKRTFYEKLQSKIRGGNSEIFAMQFRIAGKNDSWKWKINEEYDGLPVLAYSAEHFSAEALDLLQQREKKDVRICRIVALPDPSYDYPIVHEIVKVHLVK